MTSPREALADLIHRSCGCDGTCPPDEEDGRIADAILAAGWRHDGSCQDCQANLDTNGGQHEFWCGPFGSDVVVDQ